MRKVVEARENISYALKTFYNILNEESLIQCTPMMVHDEGHANTEESGEIKHATLFVRVPPN